MKLFYNASIAVLCIISSLNTNAQQNATTKPNLFNAFPSAINCSEQELSRAFNTTVGQNISLSFSNNFSFAGVLTTNMQQYSNLQTTLIKSPAFSNAIFCLSKRTETDNSVTYVGRIVNDNYGDGYMLTKNSDGTYTLNKFEAARKKQDCSHQ